MKNNQPVSQREVAVTTEQNILSTTDLKGSITYINSDFMQISGFKETELLGKNHNVVRHPDMPPAAFKSLWQSVKSGNPWMGIVKNRCKNGDHYWVDAFVMPIKDKGEIIEYQSVRYKPERQWVERAEPIYRELLKGKGFNPGISARLSLGQKLIAANILALLPVVVFLLLPALSGLQWLGLITTGLMSASLNTWLIRPFGKLADKARSIYKNSEMCRIYTGRDDEIGQIELALKMQSSQINAIVGRINDTTKNLAGLAGLNSETSSQARVGVEKQQTELTQVATAMTEMVASVKEISRSSSNAADHTVEGQKEVEQGNAVVTETIKAIDLLAEEVQQASEVISNLSQKSIEIANVLEVIKGIAEQTNLLALNAAIEAARAGENGRGFAVVADEVRTLAGRTTESASEIEQMIETLQSGGEQAVRVMDKSRIKAQNTVEMAGSAGLALQKISSLIDSITEMSLQIATASEEQNMVAEEINQSIVNIKQISETTSEGAERSVSATREMDGAINHLDNLVSQFRH